MIGPCACALLIITLALPAAGPDVGRRVAAILPGITGLLAFIRLHYGCHTSSTLTDFSPVKFQIQGIGRLRMGGRQLLDTRCPRIES